MDEQEKPAMIQYKKAYCKLYLAHKANTTRAFQFVFEKSRDAAKHNSNIFSKFNNDIHEAILVHPNSQHSYGSEFKPAHQLEELLQDHPKWSLLKKLLQYGASFPVQPMTREDRQKGISFHISRGNPQSASTHDLILEDVQRGFALPLTINTIHFLPNASLAPLGCIEKPSVNKKGEQVIKYQMTHHDQSFPGPSGLSVNKRVTKEVANFGSFSTSISHIFLRSAWSSPLLLKSPVCLNVIPFALNVANRVLNIVAQVSSWYCLPLSFFNIFLHFKAIKSKHLLRITLLCSFLLPLSIT
jgi:hypothetical protein